jgi:hypothetical protein
LALLARQVTGLRAWCEKCRFNAVIPIALAIRKIGPNGTIIDARRKLSCTKCGSRAADLMPEWPDRRGQITRHLSSLDPV